MITAHPLEHRGLKPLSLLSANRPHGDRLRYAAGRLLDGVLHDEYPEIKP